MHPVLFIRTESKSLRAGRRQNEGDYGDEGQQTARYDQIDNVVQRSSSHMKTKRDPCLIVEYRNRCLVFCKQNQEAPLPQRDRATRYVS